MELSVMELPVTELPSINLIKIGIKLPKGGLQFDLLNDFVKSGQGDALVYKKYKDDICIAKITIINTEKLLGMLIKSQFNVKETYFRVFEVLKIEVISYEARYTGNLGFEVDFKKFGVVTNALSDRSILVKTPKTFGNRPLYMKIDFDSVNKTLKWSKTSNKYFEKQFRDVVMELLLITKYIPHFYLPKDVLIELIIPDLAQYNQDMYLNKRGTHSLRNGTITNWAHAMSIHNNGYISTTGMINPIVINFIFYCILDLRKELEK